MLTNQFCRLRSRNMKERYYIEWISTRVTVDGTELIFSYDLSKVRKRRPAAEKIQSNFKFQIISDNYAQSYDCYETFEHSNI